MKVDDKLRVDQSGLQRLLSAAAVQFAEQGFAGASIASIAARAGLAKSTVFHHFGSKQALYLAVIADAASEFGRRLDDMLRVDADPGRCLSDFQHQHLEHITNNAQVTTLILSELQSPGSERAVSLAREVLAPNFQRLVDYLEEASKSGVIRAGIDCEAVALTLFAANVFYFQTRPMLTRLSDSNLARDAGAYASAVADLLLNGLAIKET